MRKFICIATIILCANSKDVVSQNFSVEVSGKVNILSLESLVVSPELEEGIYPYTEHILLPDRQKLVMLLFEQAGSIDKPVFDPATANSLSSEQVEDLYSFQLMMEFENPYWPYDVFDSLVTFARLLQDNINALHFNETWTFDQKNLLRKRVNSYGPIINGNNPVTLEPGADRLMFLVKGGWKNFLPTNVTGLISYRVILDSTSDDGYVSQSNREMIKDFFGNMVRAKAKLYDPVNGKTVLPNKDIQKIFSSDIALHAVEFYESWKISDDGMIQKDILAVAPILKQGSATILPFLYYTSEEARRYLNELYFRN